MSTRGTIKYFSALWLFSFSYHYYHECVDDKFYHEITFKILGKWYSFNCQ